jgi:hypothetical protein
VILYADAPPPQRPAAVLGRYARVQLDLLLSDH